jgi:hypothetical protein
MKVMPTTRESHTRVPRRRRATSTSMGLYPWTDPRRTASRVASKTHTGVSRRRRVASTSTRLCPWTTAVAQGPAAVSVRAPKAVAGACGDASDDCGGHGVGGTRSGACEGANDDARGIARGGANDGCGSQGAGDTRGGASGGARAGCEEGMAGRRVRPRGGGGTRDGACGGTSDSLKGGDGRSQGCWSDVGSG